MLFTESFITFYKNIKRYTVIGIVISILLSLAFIFWFKPSFVFVAGYIGTSILAVLSIPLMYRLLGYREEDESVWLLGREHEENEEIERKLYSLKNDLEGLSNKEGSHQVDVLKGIVGDYHSVVNSRFLGKKHSPLTYLSAARIVQKNALQNIADLVTIDLSRKTIDHNRLDDREIVTDKIRDRQEHQSELYEAQTLRMDVLIEENRQLFNALMTTSVEISKIESFSDFQRTDSLTRLISLSEIARHSKPIRLD